MKLEKARVRNFKIFKDTEWIDIEDNISVLVGENESGKTSFLQALEFFRKGRKNYNTPEQFLCDKTDKSSERIPIVSLEFSLDSSDRKKLRDLDARLRETQKIRITRFWDDKKEIHNENIRKKVEAPSDYKEQYNRFKKVKKKAVKAFEKYPEVKEFYQSHFDVELAADHQSYTIKELREVIIRTIKNIKAAPSPNENSRSMEFQIMQDLEEILDNLPEDGVTQGEILDILPDIIYYNQEDKLPDEARVSDLEIFESDNSKTVSNLLKLAGVEEISKYSNREPKEKFRIQSKVSRRIQVDLEEYWDQKKVEVEIRDDENNLAIFIRDIEKDGEKVERGPELPSQRSKGFNWFLSFYINFKAISEDKEDSIILLDDPAVYLHPKGKQNWIEAMEEISEKNQIVYTSHSPYSINKRHPNRVRLVKDEGKDKGKITSNPEKATKMTLEPLRSALGLDMGESLFFNKNTLLVEGETDFHIIKGLLKYFKNHNKTLDIEKNITVISCNGSNIKQYAEWMKSEKFEVKILLDNDEGGDSHAKELREQITGISTNDIERVSSEDEAEIEDIFSPDFYVKYLNKYFKDVLDNFDELSTDNSEGKTQIEGKQINNNNFSEDLEEILDKKEIRFGRSEKKEIGKLIRSDLESGKINDDEANKLKEVGGKIVNLF